MNNKRFEECTNIHQLAGVYEAIADMTVGYLRSDNETMRNWFADYVEQRLIQLKEDYNRIYEVKKYSVSEN